jgi:hypothetical protein
LHRKKIGAKFLHCIFFEVLKKDKKIEKYCKKMTHSYDTMIVLGIFMYFFFEKILENCCLYKKKISNEFYFYTKIQ